MKRYHTLALLLVGLVVLSWAAPFVLDIYLARTYGPADSIPPDVKGSWALVKLAALYLVHFGAAYWLQAEAAVLGLSRWIWGAFGLAFGLLAVVIFYLLAIYQGVGQGKRRET
jgi:hypothetical protein